TFNEMVDGLEERDRVKATFAKFHSPEVAAKLMSGEVKLGGERLQAAVFFSDVRGFTAMSERIRPEVLVSVLNRYMTAMVRVILE
ncbi:adenylate/guanylate cyclase domain-containing protein, partial [Acinetobacter baumannii]